jgi:metal-sulfur cluster biosynthetic enzyme
VEDENNKVDITFTPTIEHCSMATLIGLSIRVQLLRTLPSRFKVSTTYLLFSPLLKLLTGKYNLSSEVS